MRSDLILNMGIGIIAVIIFGCGEVDHKGRSSSSGAGTIIEKDHNSSETNTERSLENYYSDHVVNTFNRDDCEERIPGDCDIIVLKTQEKIEVSTAEILNLQAMDIGGHNDLYVVGAYGNDSTDRWYGGKIYAIEGSNNSIRTIPGYAEKIDETASGRLLVVNGVGDAYASSSNQKSWKKIRHLARRKHAVAMPNSELSAGVVDAKRNGGISYIDASDITAHGRDSAFILGEFEHNNGYGHYLYVTNSLTDEYIDARPLTYGLAENISSSTDNSIVHC